jgi:L-threonylcarbamoyladenylate synthase
MYKIGLLRSVRAHLKSGGVIAYPTESCFGLGCDPFNHKAINKILSLKNRDKKKGLIVIAGGISQLSKIIYPLPETVATYWPGPNTLLVRAKSKVLYGVTGRHSKIAVRVTAFKPVIRLCNYLNMPLISTSANPAGFQSAKTYSTCRHMFGNKIMVLPGTTGFFKRPSTIIDWDTKKILR